MNSSLAKCVVVRLLAPLLILLLLPLLDLGSAGAAVTSDAVPITVTGSPVGNIATTTGPLTPAFSQSTHDYTIRCQQGINNIALQVTGASGGTIQVGSQTGLVPFPASEPYRKSGSDDIQPPAANRTGSDAYPTTFPPWR